MSEVTVKHRVCVCCGYSEVEKLNDGMFTYPNCRDWATVHAPPPKNDLKLFQFGASHYCPKCWEMALATFRTVRDNLEKDKP